MSIVSLNETWLRSETESKLDIPGFNYVGKPRVGKKGGGVCLLLSEEITYRQLDLLPELEMIEMICVEIKSKKSSIIVLSLYRPPNQSLPLCILEIKKIFQSLKTKRQLIIVCTDHNLDLLKANCHPRTQEFLETVTNHNFVSTIKKPT